MTTHAQATLTKELEALGFTYDRTNTNGMDFYCHTTGAEIKVSISCSDGMRHAIITNAKRINGQPATTNKRKTNQIKARRAAERKRTEAAITAHRTRIAEAIKIKASAQFNNYSMQQVRKIEAFIEQEQRELRALQQLMSAPPSSRDHHARHTAGEAQLHYSDT